MPIEMSVVTSQLQTEPSRLERYCFSWIRNQKPTCHYYRLETAELRRLV